MNLWRKLSGMALGVGVGLAAGAALAQTDFSIRMPGQGLRTFADPLFWINQTPDVRLPIAERLLVPQAGLTALAPPSARRAGLTPWVSVALEGNDISNVGGSVLTATPGLRYRLYRPRFSLEAEYAVEVGLHQRPNTQNRTVRGHGGSLSMSYALNQRSRLSFQNYFTYSRDVNNAPVQGVLSPGARTTANTAILNFTHSPSNRSLLEIGWTNTQNRVKAPGAVNISENTLSAQYQYRLSEVDSLTGFASFGEFDLGPVDASKIALDVTYTRDLGRHMAFYGKFGVLHTDDQNGMTVPNIGAALTFSDRFARYTLSATRDIIAVPGLSNLALSDEIKGRALLRLDRGLILDLSLELQRLDRFDATGSDVTVATAGGKLSYALRKNNWVWAQVELSRERSGGATQTDKRLIVGLSRSFD